MHDTKEKSTNRLAKICWLLSIAKNRGRWWGVALAVPRLRRHAAGVWIVVTKKYGVNTNVDVLWLHDASREQVKRVAGQLTLLFQFAKRLHGNGQVGQFVGKVVVSAGHSIAQDQNQLAIVQAELQWWPTPESWIDAAKDSRVHLDFIQEGKFIATLQFHEEVVEQLVKAVIAKEMGGNTQVDNFVPENL